MNGITIHILFDVLAWMTAIASLITARRLWFHEPVVSGDLRFGYLVAVLFGAGLGAWAFGTANLWFSGIEQFGRSIAGALAGAILATELYKKANGITERTGAVYALPVALGIAVGRIGCLLSGLDDNTHGIATGMSWGWDFGDGIARHPVQLYESLAMASFAAAYVITMGRGSHFWRKNGFYLAVIFYGAQRFVWEFLKPYSGAIAGLTLFQILCLVLIAYGVERIWRNKKVR